MPPEIALVKPAVDSRSPAIHREERTPTSLASLSSPSPGAADFSGANTSADSHYASQSVAGHPVADYPVTAAAEDSPPEPMLPRTQVMRRGQLVIHSDFVLPERHRLIEELAAERDDIGDKLALPLPDEPIYVYLFDNEERFRRYLYARHPGLPERRAFFLEEDTRLSVLAFWGDRVGEDLRHEAAHGYLHSVLSRLPLWLDEGLAENFETPRGLNGYNISHVQRLYVELNTGRWRPDMERLEQMTAPGQMRAIDYAESWLWLHMMLETTPARKQLVRDYLSDLRREGTAGPLWPRVVKAEPQAAQELLRHLQSLAHMSADETGERQTVSDR
ncbi:hypothetical protein Pla8534_47880 [Lignipirellula cremea]|uniref:DUF1570 domain-containing protein n=2 Tax=Lignipirellula cremea TaxID=2528010 RepID=A0A518DYN5_9BACT|nr:hypothetical protein Pla8534_47880 [Lignipirellula cremea]